MTNDPFELVREDWLKTSEKTSAIAEEEDEDEFAGEERVCHVLNDHHS